MNVSLTDLGPAQLAVTSLATILMVGLGFLPRPSRATLLWSLALLFALVCIYGTVAADQLELESLRRACLGALLGTPGLVWSGLRAWRGAPPLMGIAPAFSALAALVLVAAPMEPAMGLVFHGTFLAAAVFPSLVVLELFRIPQRGHWMLYPLLAGSGGFVLAALAAIVGSLFVAGNEDLAFTRNFNSLGMLVYMVCLLLTLLWLVQSGTAGRDRSSGAEAFRAVVTDRLERAERHQESSWAMLRLNLDCVADLRSALGPARFEATTGVLDELVRHQLPAGADIFRSAPGSIVALVPRTAQQMQQIIRDLLQEVGSLDTSACGSLRLTVSAGWAVVGGGNYGLDALMRAADHGAELAGRSGGDRWFQVDPGAHSGHQHRGRAGDRAPDEDSSVLAGSSTWSG